MENVVVAGGCGFIGKALVKRLLEQDVKVYAVVRNPHRLSDLSCSKLEVLEANLSEYKNLFKLLPKDRIDVFFHLAWDGIIGSRAADIKVQFDNIKYTLETLMMASEELHAKQFLFAGSSYEHKIEPMQIDNKTVYGNSSTYGSSKHACRVMCESYAAFNRYNFKTFLFTNVFGIGDYSNRSTNTLIRQFQQGIAPSLIEGNYLHDWTYIDDAIEGILAVSQKGLPLKEYYIGKQELLTFKEIISQVRDILAPNLQLVFGTYDDQTYINYSAIDLLSLYHDTGFVCKSDFKESILKTAEWVKSIENYEK